MGWLIGWTSSEQLGLNNKYNSRLITYTSILLTVIVPEFALPIGIVSGYLANNKSYRQTVYAKDINSPSSRIYMDLNAVVRITGWAQQRGDRWQAPAIVIAKSSQAGRLNINIMDGILLRGNGRVPMMGDVLSGEIKVTVPDGGSISSGFSMQNYLSARNIKWVGNIEKCKNNKDFSADIFNSVSKNILAPVRKHLLQKIEKNIPERESVLLSSVIFAEKSPNSKIIKSAFSTTGTAHLFAVSGLHTGILVSIITLLASYSLILHRYRFLVVAIVAIFYVLLAGLPVSAIRASIFAVLIILSSFLGRKTDNLYILSLLFIIAILWQPEITSDIGFQLSFIATGVILYGLNILSSIELSGSQKTIISSLTISIFVYVGTLPIISNSFGNINAISPLINLIIIPLFSVGVWLTFSALLIPFGYLYESIFAVGWLSIRLSETVVQYFSSLELFQFSLNFSPLSILVSYLSLLILPQLCKTSKSFTLVLMSIFLIPFALNSVSTFATNSNVIVTQFDVGQGDCAILQFPNGKTVMIDTGAKWQTGDSIKFGIKQWMFREKITELSDLVITHNHSDHTGGMKTVFNSFDVDSVWIGGSEPSSIVNTYFQISMADTIESYDEWSLVCIYSGMDVSDNENNYSPILGLFYADELKYLWSGDLEVEGELDFLSKVTLTQLSTDVLKAGHHGSNTSTNQQFLEYFNPTNVIVSCGIENKHSHPSHGPFYANNMTIPVFRTDLSGTMTVEWSNNGDYCGIKPTFLDTR